VLVVIATIKFESWGTRSPIHAVGRRREELRGLALRKSSRS